MLKLSFRRLALAAVVFLAACSSPTLAPAPTNPPTNLPPTAPSATRAPDAAPTQPPAVAATVAPARGPITSPLPAPTAPPVAVRGRLLFASDETGVFQISMATFPGGQIMTLTNSPDPGDAEPRWSPDGNFIVFNSGRIAAEGFGVFRMNPDGSGQTKLISIAGKRSLNFAPQISPDGKRILFHTNRDGNFDIYVANIDGSSPRGLTNDPGNDTTPAWSPSGDQIVWSANRSGDGYQIYVARMDGAEARLLVSQPSNNLVRPAFSPDGKRIAFTIQPLVATPSKIGIVNADGAGFRVLDLGQGEFQMGDWIDNDTLVYAWRQGDSQKFKIVASRLDGTYRQLLVSRSSDSLNPSWSR